MRAESGARKAGVMKAESGVREAGVMKAGGMKTDSALKSEGGMRSTGGVRNGRRRGADRGSRVLRVWFDAADDVPAAGVSPSGRMQGWDLRIVPAAWHRRVAMLTTIALNLARCGGPALLVVTVAVRDAPLRRRLRLLVRRFSGAGALMIEERLR